MVMQPTACKPRTAPRSSTRAMLVASPHGMIQFATDRATAWLTKICGGNDGMRRLPHPIVKWMNDCAAHGQAEPFIAGTGATRVRIDLLHSEQSSFCLLLEKVGAQQPNRSSQTRPLTKREAEVLTWVARGKSNAEIATILQVCTKTVDKHLEHVYPKLGVENRTAAAGHAHAGGLS